MTTAQLETTQPLCNVASRLGETAQTNPDGVGVAEPLRRDRPKAGLGKMCYRQVTFRQLDEDSTRLALALNKLGARPGMKMALMVYPGIDFISLVFAMFKAGVVVVLIDPGMGRKNLLRCLIDVQPDGFVAISLVQALRKLLAQRLSSAKINVTVGRRWFWGGPTLDRLRSNGFVSLDDINKLDLHNTRPDDPAAIIFTTGSTGPPKGVLYRHRNFSKQADELRDFYGIQPGEIDLPGFPLFALFNCAMGVTTVIPKMDCTRPAKVDPRNIIDAAEDWRVTQAFGSPALWNTVGRYCEKNRVKFTTLRRVFTAGAPAPPHVLQQITNALPENGQMHTPYGATESLPVASIEAGEVLEETAAQSADGGGTCVGRRFPGIEWKVIRITDQPISKIDDAIVLSPGEIGELIVRGDVVTREYVTQREANWLHKIEDGEGFWHRIGDVGYLDDQDRFWFCGRKSHRVRCRHRTMFTIPCEAIINQHPRVYRSALVGIGPPGDERPVVVVETWPQEKLRSVADQRSFLEELANLAGRHPLTENIRDFLVHPSLPVDIRHNSKIFREQLGAWAAKRVG